MDYLLGLDIGTSGVKVLLISPEGKIITSKTVSYPLKTSHSGWAEQSPYDWWDATVKVIKETVSNNLIDSNQIKGISLSGQMHSSVYWKKPFCRNSPSGIRSGFKEACRSG